MKVYVFLAEGFEEIEAIAPVDIFRRAKLDVNTVSISNEFVVKGAHGVPVMADLIFDQIKFEGEFLIFLPGGLPGTTNLDAHDGLKNLIEAQYLKKGKMAAICAAPSILGKMNILRNKEAICYPGFESFLVDSKISENKIVKAGEVYTAKAAGVAVQFALEIVADLEGADIANAIKEGIYL